MDRNLYYVNIIQMKFINLLQNCIFFFTYESVLTKKEDFFSKYFKS